MKYLSIQHSQIISNLINFRFKKQSKKLLEHKDEILEQSFEIEENNGILIKEVDDWRSKAEKNSKELESSNQKLMDLEKVLNFDTFYLEIFFDGLLYIICNIHIISIGI